MYRRTSSLFPELPYGWIGLCHLALLHRDPGAARKILSENWPRYRDFVLSEETAAQLELFSRNFPEAESLYRELASKHPDGGKEFYGAVTYQSALGRLRSAAKDGEEGRQILQNALDKEFDALRVAPQHPGILYRIAAIESSLGHVEAAIDYLQHAATAGWIDYRSADLDPRFDNIAANPRFRDTLQAMQAKVQRAKQNVLNNP
jgi:tetratricopeptide (TPR) repeat protein